MCPLYGRCNRLRSRCTGILIDALSLGALGRQGLGETQRRRAVRVIFVVLPERKIAETLVKSDRRGVVAAHFEAQGAASMGDRETFASGHQNAPDPAPRKSRVDGERIEPRRRGPLAQGDQSIACNSLVQY